MPQHASLADTSPAFAGRFAALTLSEAVAQSTEAADSALQGTDKQRDSAAETGHLHAVVQLLGACSLPHQEDDLREACVQALHQSGMFPCQCIAGL